MKATTTELLKKENLTELESRVMGAFISELYAEPGFSDVNCHDLVSKTKIDIKVLRGVLGSLVKKGFIQIDEDWDDLIYLETDKYYLHPVWCSVE